MATVALGADITASVEHQTGEFSVEHGWTGRNPQHVTQSALLRKHAADHGGRRPGPQPPLAPRRRIARGGTAVVDCRCYYTTGPPALEAWRNRQIAGLANPSVAPTRTDLHLSHDVLRQNIEAVRVSRRTSCG